MNNLEFTAQNLVAFEMEYFKVGGIYKHQRYGQAFLNTFPLFEEGNLNLFYETDTSYCRSMVWNRLQGISHD